MPSKAEGRALRLHPGVARSASLVEEKVREPGLGEVLLETLEVGVCGTDIEIDEGLYGEAPPGSDTLVLGHESLLRIVEAGDGVSDLEKGQLAIAIVRRPCDALCRACAAGRWDLCETGQYRERGIRGLDGFMRDFVVDDANFVVPVPEALRSVGVLLEPLTIVEKAVDEAMGARPALIPSRTALVTGAGPVGLLAALLLIARGLEVWVLDRQPTDSPKGALVMEAGGRYIDDTNTPLERAVGRTRFDVAVEASGFAPLLIRAVNLLERNGALVLTGVTGGHHDVSLDVNVLNTNLVLENEHILGSVNASRKHYEAAVRDLSLWQRRFGKLPERLVTGRFPLERFRDALDKNPGTIKSVIEVST